MQTKDNSCAAASQTKWFPPVRLSPRRTIDLPVASDLAVIIHTSPAETSPSPSDLVTLVASLLKRYDVKEVDVKVAGFTLTRGKNLRIQSRLSLQSLHGEPLRLQARAQPTNIATATDRLEFRELQATLPSSIERPDELSLETRVDASARSGFAITAALDAALTADPFSATCACVFLPSQPETLRSTYPPSWEPISRGHST